MGSIPRVRVRGHGWLFLYVVILMTAFNFFSHGTQDLYPLFLQVEKGYGTDLTGKLSLIGPIGAIITPQFMGVQKDPWLPFASQRVWWVGPVRPARSN